MKKFICGIIAFLTFSMALSLNTYAASEMNYSLSNDGKRIMTPLSYSCNTVIAYLGEKGGTFIDSSDIFIDREDNIYITNTAKNRIIKLDKNGNYLRDFTNNGNLNGPQSVFVCDNSDIFISDTGNKRIVHINQNDEEIEAFVKPESTALSDTTDFLVNHLAVSDQGLIYVVQSQQFMTIDANNEFKGYVGANKVGFNLKEFFVRTFGSEIQKNKMQFSQASTYNSFDIGEDGLIYAVANDTVNQIRILNIDGDNLFPNGSYGENNIDGGTADSQTSIFTDISADENGIIYALDRNSGRVYVYTSEGDSLVVFGGLGNICGKFQLPVALDHNSKGEIFVLDSAAGAIHKFTPTSYMNNIKSAYTLFKDGEYEKSFEVCNSILAVNSNSSFTNTLIGRIEYKKKNYEVAMDYFKRADNKEQYAKAFSEARHDIFRAYFAWIVLAVLIIITAVFILIGFLRKKSNAFVNSYYSGDKE